MHVTIRRVDVIPPLRMVYLLLEQSLEIAATKKQFVAWQETEAEKVSSLWRRYTSRSLLQSLQPATTSAFPARGEKENTGQIAE